jgi:hypothetical protein
MGEGADMALEAIWDFDEYMMRERDEEQSIYAPNYRIHEEGIRVPVLPAFKYVENGVVKQTTQKLPNVVRGTRECEHCGRNDLIWGVVDEKWRLFEPDTGVIHHCEQETFAEPRFNKQCKYCGRWGLGWSHIDDKWVLINKRGKRHFCKVLKKTEKL